MQHLPNLAHVDEVTMLCNVALTGTLIEIERMHYFVRHCVVAT